MKKTLTLALVLVMALASTVFAGVDYQGEFELKWDQTAEKLEWFNGGFTFNPGATLKIKPNASGDNWNFNFTIASEKWWNTPYSPAEKDIPFTIEQYKLNVRNEYFTLNLWRRDWVGDKGDPAGLLPTAGGWPHGEDRVRLEVPVVDLATITADYEVQRRSIFTFVDFDVADTPIGLRYNHLFGEAPDSVGAYAKLNFSGVEVQPVVGITFADDNKDNLGFGVKASASLSDDLNANINFKERQANFQDGRLRELDATLDYTDFVRGQVNFKQTGNDLDVTTTKLTMHYRANPTKGWGDLTDDGNWFRIHDIAARAEVTLAKDKTTYEAWFTTPIVINDLAVRANAKYEEENYNVKTDLRYQVNDNVHVAPKVTYASASEELNLTGNVGYNVGNLNIGFEVGHTFKPEGEADTQNASLSIKVNY